MTGALLLLLAIVLALIGNGFFSGSEIAILSARKSRIETLVAQGSRSAKRLKALRDRPETFLATVQIGVTVMGTLAGVLGGYLASLYIEPSLASLPIGRYILPSALAAGLVSGLIVYVELTLGELVPKALALRFSEPIALVVAWPLATLARLSAWAVRVLTVSTRSVLLMMGIRGQIADSAFISTDEIKHMVKEGHDQGVLDKTEVELIHSVFKFSETPVKKVMVPRPKIFAMDAATLAEDIGRVVVESGFSRIPVCEGSIDSIIGLVYVKDVLRLLEKRQPVLLRKILHPVHFVPETKRVGSLLKELQRRRSHMALVIDEHGSVTGLVTLEDLIEEIVGEIRDEYDWEERPVERLRDGSLVVEGTMPAADLREH
ncbi:MAG: hemolysin family protein, partial [Vicinamibacteria bacterium]|nr:hemolysin family protein [Vicinamibacteria bacterium]